jgi:hypothetical protein
VSGETTQEVLGAGGASDAGIGWDQCSPFTGCAHSGGA